MYLLSRAPIIDVNPSDGKEYEYTLEFIESMNSKNTQYLYKFKRSRYPIGDIGNNTMGADISAPSFLIELHESFNSDLEKICVCPGKYWYYYWNKYNHYTPRKIYCKFNREDELVYTVDQTTPSVIDVFNGVLNMYDVTEGPKYGFPKSDSYDNIEIGYGPIFEINVWVPRNKTIRESLTKDIRNWISEYVNTIMKNNNEKENALKDE